VLALLGGRARASYLDDIGLTQLQAEQGSALASGTGMRVCQVEAELDANTQSYTPDPNSFVSGKVFNFKSGTYAPSWHATDVGEYFYGTWGAAPGISTVDVYAANSPAAPLGWMGNGFLNTGNARSLPNVEAGRIENHSWVGAITPSSSNTEILRRLDYAINRDGFLAVVGLNNAGSGATEMPLLAESYNALSVGRSDGGAIGGYTALEGPGRVLPDIVAPMGATSWATPLVSGSAAVLLQTADNNPLWTDARSNSEVIKSMLMAGATKQQLPGWSRTTTRPLDPNYGAGQLNIYNSYHILTGGEHAASTSANLPGTSLTDGWDFETITSSSTQRQYYFTVPAGCALRDFSTVLNWNRTITPVAKYGLPYYQWNSSLANLDLQLSQASNFVVGSTVDASQSPIDNVEHIYRGAADPNLPTSTNELGPGQYALSVSANFAGTSLTSSDYALAWRGSLMVEDPAQVALPGDFNLDGKVDGVDFLIWQSHYGTASGATLLNGDANGDGNVDGVDFLTWQAAYRPGITTVPEPAAALLLLAAGSLLRRGRKRLA
jgi:hypothetical protein